MRQQLARILYFSSFAAAVFIEILLYFAEESISDILRIFLFSLQFLLLGAVLFLFLLKPKAVKKSRGDRKLLQQQEEERKMEIRRAKKAAKERRIKESETTLLKGIAGENSEESLGKLLLKNFAEEFSIVRGLVYTRLENGEFTSVAQYAYYGKDAPPNFAPGEGFNGQVAQEKKVLLLEKISEGYIEVVSGLGAASASELLIIPFVSGNKTIALAEFAALKKFPDYTLEVLKKVQKTYAENLKKIKK